MTNNDVPELMNCPACDGMARDTLERESDIDSWDIIHCTECSFRSDKKDWNKRPRENKVSETTCPFCGEDDWVKSKDLEGYVYCKCCNSYTIEALVDKRPCEDSLKSALEQCRRESNLIKEALEGLVRDCLATDFNEHWGTYTDALNTLEALNNPGGSDE